MITSRPLKTRWPAGTSTPITYTAPLDSCLFTPFGVSLPLVKGRRRVILRPLRLQSILTSVALLWELGLAQYILRTAKNRFLLEAALTWCRRYHPSRETASPVWTELRVQALGERTIV